MARAPAGVKDVVWRHSANPVIGRRPLPDVLGIYNSAVVPFGDGFAAVFRLEDRTRFPRLHMGWSDDGLQWHIEPSPIVCNRPDDGDGRRRLRLRPARVKIEDKYYITWCGGHNGPTISVASDDRLPEVHAARQRLPPAQSQRRAVSAADRRQVLHAEPAQRQRPHAVRRHLHQPKPRPDPLGQCTAR